MSQTDYAAMTDEQLKHYIATHSSDKAALSVYLERRNAHRFPTIANIRDMDFDDKLRTAIAQKLENSATI
ncbi:DUF6887 family protein [Altericista sp. CCNU0014]|uniref:DUF6887 family protein n=1 Tax=Altericista sp. CCNU0014 TaxID=3082949 RepID=UPI00384D9379